MTLNALPKAEKFNLNNINSKEAFKKGIDIFFTGLLQEAESYSRSFNYVCREILEFLEYGKEDYEITDESSTPQQNFISDYMKQMDIKFARQNVILSDAFIPGDYEDIVHRTKN